MTVESEESPAGRRSSFLQPIGAGLSVGLIYLVALSLPIRTSQTLGLDRSELAAWILALWAVAGSIGLVMSIRARVPLLLTGNLFVIILMVRVSALYQWADLVGASLLAGVVVLAGSRTNLTDRLSRWLPPSIIYGLLVGAVLPFLLDMFSLGVQKPWLVTTAVAVYLASTALRPALPAIIPAVAVAAVVAAVSGEFAGQAAPVDLVIPTVTSPGFDLTTILAVTPVMIVLITIQSNVPSLVFLREQGFDFPTESVTVVSGAGTIVGSFFGPTGISLSLPLTAITAVPDAGRHDIRYRAAAVAHMCAIAIGVFAGAAVFLTSAVPSELLTVAIGLAFLGVVVNAVPRMVDTGLRWGPVLTLIIAASDLTLVGLSSFFWAIVVGLLATALIDTRSPNLD
jgi:benzoate membrane transport protein